MKQRTRVGKVVVRLRGVTPDRAPAVARQIVEAAAGRWAEGGATEQNELRDALQGAAGKVGLRPGEGK